MPILPKQRDFFPGDLIDAPAVDGRRSAPATTCIARWIPPPAERMLVMVRFLDQGSFIEREDMELEPL